MYLQPCTKIYSSVLTNFDKLFCLWPKKVSYMKKFIASYPREFAVQRFFSFNYFEAQKLKNPKNATGFVMKNNFYPQFNSFLL